MVDPEECLAEAARYEALAKKAFEVHDYTAAQAFKLIADAWREIGLPDE